MDRQRHQYAVITRERKCQRLRQKLSDQERPNAHRRRKRGTVAEQAALLVVVSRTVLIAHQRSHTLGKAAERRADQHRCVLDDRIGGNAVGAEQIHELQVVRRGDH